MIARAYELARAGSIANIGELVGCLKREGYELVEVHLRSSPTLTRQLRSLCKDAWSAAGNSPIPNNWRP
jgi:hypothetical protein